MRSLFFSLFLCLSGGLAASEDPFLARLSAPLPDSATVSVQVSVREFTRDLWVDRNGNPVKNGGTYALIDANGNTSNQNSIKGFCFDLDLLWALGRHTLGVSLPYYNQEFSPYAGQVLPSNLDDASARREDATGDLSLQWRALWLGRKDGPFAAGTGLEVSVPTGQGPFTSAHPLLATGLGGAAMALDLSLEGRAGDWLGWLQGRLPYEFGYSADIAPGTFVAYVPGQKPETLAGGRAWVSRSPSYTATAGLGWDWYASDSARHRVAVELQLDQLGAMRLDGAEVPYSSSLEWDLVPQARFSFGRNMALNFGWILPFAANRAASYWGDILIRADYSL